jgi:hypothetical protein
MLRQLIVYLFSNLRIPYLKKFWRSHILRCDFLVFGLLIHKLFPYAEDLQNFRKGIFQYRYPVDIFHLKRPVYILPTSLVQPTAKPSFH